MTTEERLATEPVVAAAIAEVAAVYPKGWFTAWAAAWSAGDEDARANAEAIIKLVPQVHVDPSLPAGQAGDPFLETLAAYARAEGQEPSRLDPAAWLALARRVRVEHPDTVPDEALTHAAGARAAEEAAGTAQSWHDGHAPARAIIEVAEHARMWATEARERLSGAR